MTERKPSPVNAQRRQIIEQAASWYIDQREGLDARQHERFLAWLQRSPQHVAEYVAMAQMHGDLQAVVALDDTDIDTLQSRARSEGVVVNLHRTPPRPPHAQTVATPRRRPWLQQALAAALVLAVGGAAFLGTAAKPWQAYTAGTDATHDVALPDGTHLLLDSHSAVLVRYDAAQRDIHVVHGGAMFDVVHDPARPLHVQLGANELEDIGTVFDAHLQDDGNRVTVVSGRVKVWRDDASPWLSPTRHVAVADLGAGMHATLHTDGALAALETHADLATDTAWLPTDIQFERASVAEVARRFNAYGSRPLVVDARVGAMRISGRFHARDVDAFVAYLHGLPGVRVVQHDTDVHVYGDMPVTRL